MTTTGTNAPSHGGLAQRPAVTVIVPVYKGRALADFVIRSLIDAYCRLRIRIGLRKYVSGGALLMVSATALSHLFCDRIGASTRVLRRAGPSSP